MLKKRIFKSEFYIQQNIFKNKDKNQDILSQRKINNLFLKQTIHLRNSYRGSLNKKEIKAEEYLELRKEHQNKKKSG